MAVCGCGQTLAGAPPILDGGTGDDLGIIVSGTFDNTVVTAVAATAWRPLSLSDITLTNFTLGNGKFNGRYLADGFNIDAIISFEFGTTSTFAASPWVVSLPFTPQAGVGIINNHQILGQWSVFDASAVLQWFQGAVYRTTGGDMSMRFGDDASGTNQSIQQGVPITFAAGDELSFKVRFEADDN